MSIIGDKDQDQAQVDDLTPSLVTLSEEHWMSHKGFMYAITGKETGLLNAGVEEFIISVPANSYPHIQRLTLGFGRGDVDVETYEGTITSADGTEMTNVQNTNRNSPNTPDITLYSGPTITDDGTLIHSAWAPPTATGTGQSANGATGSVTGEEWVLKPNTKYLVRITNNSGATIDWTYAFLWYEIGIY